ncbi:unnamed protein product [Spirodela intermedia]|uniref:Uncharacterized protein n=1 Tax=Spirodela intermedia TaxID=51605 RepID=A0A7I8JXZ8_SPIIN|nr:unnamed protein product [Spirodela intermedia]
MTLSPGYESNHSSNLVCNNYLAQEFDVKNLGQKYFLGIEVAHSSKGIFISQQKYITDLLAETGKSKLSMANEEISINCEMYQHLIGRLLYLTHTQLDISYAMSILNQFMHQLKECHLHAAYQVLHYLKGTPRKGVLFKQSEKVEVEMFTDADYAGSTIDQKSIFNHITFVGGNLVTWRSKKQNVVAQSSAGAELRALTQGYVSYFGSRTYLTSYKFLYSIL